MPKALAADEFQSWYTFSSHDGADNKDLNAPTQVSRQRLVFHTAVAIRVMQYGHSSRFPGQRRVLAPSPQLTARPAAVLLRAMLSTDGRAVASSAHGFEGFAGAARLLN